MLVVAALTTLAAGVVPEGVVVETKFAAVVVVEPVRLVVESVEILKKSAHYHICRIK